MKKYFALLILSSYLFSCDNVKAEYMTVDTKKAQLRYFITINYTYISNEMLTGQGEYLSSLLSEVSSFDKTVSKERILQLHQQNTDPFDFAMALTKELN